MEKGEDNYEDDCKTQGTWRYRRTRMRTMTRTTRTGTEMASTRSRCWSPSSPSAKIKIRGIQNQFEVDFMHFNVYQQGARGRRRKH